MLYPLLHLLSQELSPAIAFQRTVLQYAGNCTHSQ